MSHIVSLIAFYTITIIIFLIILAVINRKTLIAKWKFQRNVYRLSAYKFWGMK